MTETSKPSSSTVSAHSHFSNENIPPVETPHKIGLESVKDSKIISVSVYSGRAEITRLFTFVVKTGQNQIQISGLPPVLDQDSFRVEGRGAATIHDVTLSHSVGPPAQGSVEGLEELTRLKKHVDKALDRTKRSISSLETYLSSVNAQHLDVAKLADVINNYNKAAGELDNKVDELEAQKKTIESDIEAEMVKLRQETGEYNTKLSMKASIGIFADHEGEIKIVLLYAVTQASWTAGYDVRVDMQTRVKPVQMVYKATITQNTGEDWNNVALVLETVNPTFRLSVPELDQWTLSVYKPPVPILEGVASFYPSYGISMLPTPAHPTMSHAPPPMAGAAAAPVQHRGADVSSRGTVSATFSVPGLITIPSDGVAHNVTITELSLDATMSWVCVPKKDTKTHIKALISNASEYTLLPGKANVYVDGSFVSKTSIPLVSPEESFEFPLGLDPSIRVAYHPRSKRLSRSGFYTKSITYTFQQRITIHNTKTHSINGFRVLDQFPISEDSNITVKRISPPLILPSSDSDITDITGSGTPIEILSVKVSQDVIAQWDGTEAIEKGDLPLDSVGKEGKVAWICSIPAGSKLGLTLHWEVTTPAKTEIVGL